MNDSVIEIEGLAVPPEERIKLLRRCYSLYLWAYTVSVSGGTVDFELADDAMAELGPETVFAHQESVATGASQGRRGARHLSFEAFIALYEKGLGFKIPPAEETS